MPSLMEILKDPNYVNANEATKAAIFNKYAPLDPNFANANEATQFAIRQKFGVAFGSMEEEKVPTAPTTLRDIAVSGASGVVGGIKSLTDVFGADNSVSQTLGETGQSLQKLYTPERQKEIEYYQNLQKEAAEKGDTLGEVIGALKSVKAAPLQGTMQALGSLVPNLMTLFVPVAGEARALQLSRGAINTAIGIVQGTGSVKGAIYEGVKQELIKNGVDEATAARKAEEAQSYLGDNANQILGGAALGYVAGKTGAETLLTGKAPGLVGKAASVGSEFVTEAGQGGQEQVAQNIALQNQGFNVPTFQGVVGTATQEGLMGMLGATPLTLLHSRPSIAEVPDAKPVEDKQIPLLLEGKGVFIPVALPDGSVAMTREDLAAYEEEKFRKQYEPQPVDSDDDGPTEPPAGGSPVMPTDAGLNYATATQEIELLKRQPPSEQNAARIQELQQYKLESLNDRINAARLPVSPELQAIRAQMERGDLTYEGQQKLIDQMMAEFYASPKGFKGIEKTAAPLTDLQLEIKELQKEATAVAKEYKAISSAKTNNALKSDIAGLLSPEEVASEIGMERQYRYLAAPKGKLGKPIADLVADGVLDKYLPPDMRSDSGTFDNQASEEYIKELLRNADFAPFDAKINSRLVGEKLSQLDARIKELTEPQQRLAELSPEDTAEETARIAEEAGYFASPQPEEVLPSLEELEAQNELVTDDTNPAVRATDIDSNLGDTDSAVPAADAQAVETPVADANNVGVKRGLYQEAQPGEQGLPKSVVDKVVNTIKTTWKNAPEIEVVQSTTDLPDYLQAQMAKDKVNPRGVFDPNSRKVYLVADNISSQVQAAITLAHEALGHYGLRIVLGKNFVPMMHEIYAKNNAVRRRADAYMEEGLDKATAVEEVLSEMAQEVYDTRVRPGDIRLSALQKIINAVRQFLARLGVPMKTITNAEVLKLIAQARKAVVSGGASAEIEGGRAKYTDTLSANFKKWFGKSKVVDAKGKPLRMYHGTYSDIAEPKTNFDKDEYSKFGFHVGSIDAASNRLDIKAEEDQKEGQKSGNAGPNIIPVYVRAENPLRLDENRSGRWGVDDIMNEILAKAESGEIDGISDEDINSMYEGEFDIEEWLAKHGKPKSPNAEDYGSRSWSNMDSFWPGERTKLLKDFIKTLGYDSIVYKNEFEGGGDSYILLDPNQVKSAIGNSGEYSRSSSDLRYSAKERIERVARRMSSKRPEMKQDAFADVDSDFVESLKKHFFPENKTIVDRIEGMRGDFWKKLAQGVADQYRTIKDYTPMGYMLARMSKTVDGALEGILFNGHVFLNDGALDIKGNTKGLIQTMEPVGKEVDRFQIWMALNRDAQLVRQGKIPSVDPALVARAGELSKGRLGGQSRLEVYEKVRKDLNALNRSVLDVARKQGLIDAEAYQIFANDINYIPFYKAMEDGDVQSAATASGLGRQEFSKALKGGEKPFGDLMENTLRNWSHILSAAMKNKAANVTLDAAMEMGAAYPNLKVGFEWRDGKVYSSKSDELVGDGKLKAEYTTQKAGMVKTMLDGKPAYFEVIDPLLLDSISSIGYMGPKSKFLDVAKDFKNLLQFGVTLSPAFKVRNLFRDSISAIAVSDMDKNPFANVVKGWTLSNTKNPAHISALAGGGIFNFGSYYEGDQSRLIKRLLDQGVEPDTILDSDQKIKAGLMYAWRKYQDWGNKSEAANRMALYQQMRDRGMSHLEASFYARDMLDFSMQGSWPAFRLLTQVVPFLNARVQGLYKLGRDGIMPTSRVLYNTVTGKPLDLTDKQKAAQFSAVTGAVVLASMLLYLLNKDDEEFQKREAWDRDNFWWFRLPGMETALRVPKPFEIGAFGTLAERTLEQIVDQGAEGRQFEESLRRMLGDTFALNPVPQAFKPLLDLYANKDSFTGAPIETAGMERLSKQERASDMTSPLAKALGGISHIMGIVAGEKAELSPVQIDYAIKSYLGWLGGTIAFSSHYAVMPFSKGAYPDHNWSETMSLGFVKSLPQTQSRYVTEFYQSAKEISQAYADMRHYAELGQSDKVQEIMESRGDKVALAKVYDKAAKDMAEIRKAISSVQNDETLSGADKKEQIDRLKLIIDKLAEQMEGVRKSLRK